MANLDSTGNHRLVLPENVLNGEVAVITGAGRGIGREIARLFASLGAAVVIAELEKSGADVQEEIQAAGGRALYIPVDVSDETSVENLVKITNERFGWASILINNAILSPVAAVLDLSVEEWDRVMAVNLKGAFLTCRAFLPAMLRHKRGTILNLVSTEAMPYLSAYIASKQGLCAFSQSLAGEVGEQGVRVIPFGPGFVNTPGLRNTAEKLAPQLGMGWEEFINLPMHAAYPGAMPAEDAALAAAYLVTEFADEFHGEAVTGYAILERAGYLSGEKEEGVQLPHSQERPATTEETTTAVKRAVEFANVLTEVLDDTEAEFRKLPLFVRPLAKSGFKGKAGMSTGDWQKTLQKLTVILQNHDYLELGKLEERLVDLERYYLEVPEETARFVKHPDALQEVRDRVEERIDVIRGLKEAIGRVQKAQEG